MRPTAGGAAERDAGVGRRGPGEQANERRSAPLGAAAAATGGGSWGGGGAQRHGARGWRRRVRRVPGKRLRVRWRRGGGAELVTGEDARHFYARSWSQRHRWAGDPRRGARRGRAPGVRGHLFRRARQRAAAVHAWGAEGAVGADAQRVPGVPRRRALGVMGRGGAAGGDDGPHGPVVRYHSPAKWTWK